MQKPTHHVVSDGTVKGTIIYDLTYDDPLLVGAVSFLSITLLPTGSHGFYYFYHPERSIRDEQVCIEMHNPKINLLTATVSVYHDEHDSVVYLNGKEFKYVRKLVILADVKESGDIVSISLDIVPLFKTELAK